MILMISACLFLGLCLYAAVHDVATLIIPNWLNAALVLLFFPAALAAGLETSVIGQHVMAGGIAFVIATLLFVFGIWGGGDAKMIPGAILWIGPGATLPFITGMVWAGAAMCILLLIARRTAPKRAATPLPILSDTLKYSGTDTSLRAGPPAPDESYAPDFTGGTSADLMGCLIFADRPLMSNLQYTGNIEGGLQAEVDPAPAKHWWTRAARWLAEPERADLLTAAPMMFPAKTGAPQKKISSNIRFLPTPFLSTLGRGAGVPYGVAIAAGVFMTASASPILSEILMEISRLH